MKLLYWSKPPERNQDPPNLTLTLSSPLPLPNDALTSSPVFFPLLSHLRSPLFLKDLRQNYLTPTPSSAFVHLPRFHIPLKARAIWIPNPKPGTACSQLVCSCTPSTRAMQHAQSSTEGQPPHVLPTGPHAPLGREALLPSQVSPRKHPKKWLLWTRARARGALLPLRRRKGKLETGNSPLTWLLLAKLLADVTSFLLLNKCFGFVFLGLVHFLEKTQVTEQRLPSIYFNRDPIWSSASFR